MQAQALPAFQMASIRPGVAGGGEMEFEEVAQLRRLVATDTVHRARVANEGRRQRRSPFGSTSGSTTPALR